MSVYWRPGAGFVDYRAGVFYKQSAPIAAPFPVLIYPPDWPHHPVRKSHTSYGKSPTVTAFSERNRTGIVYRRARETRKDIVQADVGKSVYSIVREKDGMPIFAAGFNTSGLWRGRV